MVDVNWMLKTIVCTLGRTATGKTTISKYLASSLGVSYISEGEIKRALVHQNKEYDVNDCLDEALRDIAYEEAVRKAKSILCSSDCVIIDASFHKFKRRQLVYDLAHSIGGYVVFLYTICRDISIIQKRIMNRKTQDKTYETHADSFRVYEYINATFDEPTYDEIRSNAATVIEISTSIRDVRISLCANESREANEINSKIMGVINGYLC